jgi:hypothetical protein
MRSFLRQIAGIEPANDTDIALRVGDLDVVGAEALVQRQIQV